MSYSVINGITTPSQPTTAATLLCPGSARINIEVENSPIYYQFGDGAGGAPVWRNPVRMAPGFRSFDQLADAVRVWSYTPAAPAVVTVAAMTPAELSADG